ncbi:MAG: hypothetical protein NTW50_02095 [Candidatus Berkelbacteria bacterium]|nr:hypothetical protein [Candidatus Berkelbacteria bacterium]
MRYLLLLLAIFWLIPIRAKDLAVTKQEVQIDPGKSAVYCGEANGRLIWIKEKVATQRSAISPRLTYEEGGLIFGQINPEGNNPLLTQIGYAFSDIDPMIDGKEICLFYKKKQAQSGSSFYAARIYHWQASEKIYKYYWTYCSKTALANNNYRNAILAEIRNADHNFIRESLKIADFIAAIRLGHWSDVRNKLNTQNGMTIDRMKNIDDSITYLPPPRDWERHSVSEDSRKFIFISAFDGKTWYLVIKNDKITVYQAGRQ